jgi:hypothetical protein
MARIELVTMIAAPRDRCFDLARSVDMHTRSTVASSERAIGGRTRGLLVLGDEVTWRARHLGVWQTLTSRITAYERPTHFRDSMVRGAFARFDYAAPLGRLGRVAEVLVLTSYLRRFLEARNREIKSVAESDAWRELLPGA